MPKGAGAVHRPSLMIAAALGALLPMVGCGEAVEEKNASPAGLYTRSDADRRWALVLRSDGSFHLEGLRKERNPFGDFTLETYWGDWYESPEGVILRVEVVEFLDRDRAVPGSLAPPTEVTARVDVNGLSFPGSRLWAFRGSFRRTPHDPGPSLAEQRRHLLARLQDSSPEARAEALRKLWPNVASYRDGPAPLSGECAYSIHGEVLEALMRAMGDSDQGIAASARMQLEEQDPVAWDDVRTLGLAGMDGDTVRARLRDAASPDGGVPHLLSVLRMFDAIMRPLDPAAVKILAELLRSSDSSPEAWKVRRCVAWLLGESPLGLAGVDHALREASTDPHDEVAEAVRLARERRLRRASGRHPR